ncbi:MAG TPA: bifunctional [glutamate--ammonia ligase]-adenylyl-L-tyrosine phosphorylase/[glutamate--ammonia-ligase] adenylyltransferase [Chthoniobacterales bacterium]|nr:bifunctional [glutamate--ammonia ligase]-adenylyl-L-tyrosine phosphorylase/[glutamate--ammonia-ligase] adenylyltransferase [Chthoniobacterales bacterium]
MPANQHWIKERSANSLDPPQVESRLKQIAENWPVTALPLEQIVAEFPLGPEPLLHLLAVSTICASRLQRSPETLLWLTHPDICLSRRGPAQMANELHGYAGDKIADDNFRLLRLWKGREMVRVALREIANVAPLEETTAELSQIAENCIRHVLGYWNTELRRKFGSPDTEFTVLGLGKLGGGELNHSSDVDVIFVYGEEGQLSPRLSYHEFFNRLSAKIIETFSSSHPEGPLFRIDLRLRPEGSAGPLARSLESMSHYYYGFGETWERLALIKARGVAGDRELAYEFLRQHQPFIYPRSPTPDLLDEIASIKRRIERDVVGHEALDRDVKLGRGGIREIEFVVQTLQFIHGARHAFLQDTSTLRALQGIAQLELLPKKDVLELDRAYRFLRRTEHRLQIEAEQQTHTLPTEAALVQRLAVSLGFESPAKFRKELQQEMQRVHAIFRRVIADPPATKKKDTLDLSAFTNPDQASKSIERLAQGSKTAHLSQRTKQVFRKLRPLLIAQLSRIANPDATLTQLVRFVEAYGLRNMLFELLVTNPNLLKLLITTFDDSRFAADLLVRHPQLLEDTTRDDKLDSEMDVVAHLQQLEVAPNKDDDFEYVRAYRQAQLLRILLRDVVGLTDLTGICREQSNLAEACLIHLVQKIGADDLTIMAMGKFGGREIGYGADLDVLFVGDNIRAAQKLLSIIAQPSAEGNLPRVDARLRPEGEKGPLVSSVEAFSLYYTMRAQMWELQALTRARPVMGPLQGQFMAIAKGAWRHAGEQPNLFGQINDMLQRIRRDRSAGSDFISLKTGTGGIIEAEFLVQALQMRANIWQPNWSEAVAQLAERKEFSATEASTLKSAYQSLRRCESVLRRYENAAVSALPADPVELLRLSRRLGFKSVEEFKSAYEAARASIHEIYVARVERASITTSPTLAEQES